VTTTNTMTIDRNHTMPHDDNERVGIHACLHLLSNFILLLLTTHFRMTRRVYSLRVISHLTTSTSQNMIEGLPCHRAQVYNVHSAFFFLYYYWLTHPCVLNRNHDVEGMHSPNRPSLAQNLLITGKWACRRYAPCFLFCI
jgi:hypothetical protein